MAKPKTSSSTKRSKRAGAVKRSRHKPDRGAASASTSRRSKGMKAATTRDASESSQSDQPEFLVVGIGASAGGLEALSQLLGALPNNAGMAYVVVQHLAANHDSMLPELLGGATNLTVVQVTDGVRVAPDKVYVIPPNTQMGIMQGMLRLLPRPE